VSDLRLTLHQMSYDARSTLRNPPAVFFGLLMPVIFLLIFATVFGNDTVAARGGIKTSTYYVPTIVALGVISTTLMNLAISLVVLRENRVLKRLRGTPLPMRVFVAGRVTTAIGLAVLLTLVLLAVGKVVYGARLPDSTAPGLAAALAVGAASFCCIGIAISSAIPNEDSAPPLLNLVVLPLYFISGIFFPMENAPHWLSDVADVFPIKHLAEALLEAFDPRTAGAGVAWGDLAVVGAWGLAGLLAALLLFRWTPKGE
jgi:ABC-2 type transport system permease protein